MTAGRLLCIVGMLLTVGCNLLTGVADYSIVADGAGLPENGDGGTPTTPPDLSRGRADWTYRRPITISSELSSTVDSYPVLVVLPSNFEYSKAKPDGADLRFSKTAEHGDDLPYWIERWAPNGLTAIWVLVPTVPQLVSTIHLFYGNPSATTASLFDDVFKRVQKTAGGGAGSFAASANIDVDWFELAAGDTITVAAGTPLRIAARRIIVDGSIDGDAKGYSGGLDADGQGPGGGHAKSGAGGGGGGYGGKGGGGGNGDEQGGAAGVANGSSNTIDMGSGGAGGAIRAGGSGGGALTLLGWSVSVKGSISMNGQNGSGAAGAEQAGGGGAGGGILVAGAFLDLAGSTLRANGGAGGSLTSEYANGGGGGGGGRVNLYSRKTGRYAAPLTLSVSFGAASVGGGENAAEQPGSTGITYVGQDASMLPGVEASVGEEVASH